MASPGTGPADLHPEAGEDDLDKSACCSNTSGGMWLIAILLYTLHHYSVLRICSCGESNSTPPVKQFPIIVYWASLFGQWC